MLHRRDVLIGALGLAMPGAALSRSSRSASLVDLEEAELAGGRFGFAAVDLASRRMLLHRPDARFAFCSTYKVPLTAAVLAEVDAGRLAGERAIPITAADLLPYAPATRAALPDGQMSVFALCEAAVVLSDNSAANLLLPLVGGPPGLTRFVRAQGDRTTRVDRNEPSLNTNLPGDPRDTTTPRATLALLEHLLVGPALSEASRTRLIGWMVRCSTGTERLRAGLPSSWRVGDKTGSGERGAFNDIAIAYPPGRRAPVLIASFVDAPHATLAQANAAQAAAAARFAALVG